jgi:beta-galactosidase GanA
MSSQLTIRFEWKTRLRGLIVAFICTASLLRADDSPVIPHIDNQGTASRLIVDGKPFLVLGGELRNSSSSSLDYMKPIWPRLAGMHLNTVLTPVSWELIEPEEGKFDFKLVDGLIHDARASNLHLVFLWFGSWKNSMSSYAPVWVKTNQSRFPRSQKSDGAGIEILSPFNETNWKTDARAFAALMQHIRQVDKKHTVIMVQVENEIGMIPEARDHSAAANQAFAQPVPKELMDYLQAHKETLIPEFREVWAKTGFKTSGTWEEVFGAGIGTEEIFMAWWFARYTDQVAASGKAAYPLPMYVNAALIRPNFKPGQYPSAGPLPHLLDVWRAGAPRIDFLSPDIYFPNFAEWCGKYHRSGNPLFIPEALRDTANPFYAFGQCDAMGFSPFAIDDPPPAPGANEPSARQPDFGRCYEVLSQLAPLILENQGKGTMAGVLLDETNQTQKIHLGDFTLNVSHDYTWAGSRDPHPSPWPRFGGLVICMGPGEYLVAGSGLIVTFASDSTSDPIAGIESIEEGWFANGHWIAGRRLNGDENHQGRHLRLVPGQIGIQLVKLYRYH